MISNLLRAIAQVNYVEDQVSDVYERCTCIALGCTLIALNFIYIGLNCALCTLIALNFIYIGSIPHYAHLLRSISYILAQLRIDCTKSHAYCAQSHCVQSHLLCPIAHAPYTYCALLHSLRSSARAALNCTYIYIYMYVCMYVYERERERERERGRWRLLFDCALHAYCMLMTARFFARDCRGTAWIFILIAGYCKAYCMPIARVSQGLLRADRARIAERIVC
jgi:hypothetical protein